MIKHPVKYHFNESSLRFEPVTAKNAGKIFGIVANCLGALVLGFLSFLLFSRLFDSPELRSLKEENEKMEIQYGLLQLRANELEELMDELERRDDNMYRAILQAEPLENRQGSFQASRYADLQNMTHFKMVTQLTRDIDELARRVYVQSNSYDELAELIRNNEDRLRHVPSIQPIAYSAMNSESSGFGNRIDPIYGTVRFHAGLDFSTPIGTDVYATADGVVTTAEYNRGGYGYLVVIDHGYDYMTYYAHLKNVNKVYVGKKVKRGDIIAESGHTGKSTNPHLHYEVRYKGEPDNPVRYFFQDLSPEEYDDMLTRLANSGLPMD